METRFRWRSGWRFVVAVHPRKSRFATAPIRRLGFKRRKRRFPNPPKAKPGINPRLIVIERKGESAFFILMRNRFSLVIAGAVWIVALLNLSGAEPLPQTPKKPVTDEYQGVKVEDNYQWLEQDDDPAG